MYCKIFALGNGKEIFCTAVLTDSDTTYIMLPSLFPFLALMGESYRGQIDSWSIIIRLERMFSKTRYMLILPLFSFDQGREMAFLFWMHYVHHYAWKIVGFMSATSIHSLFWSCIGFYSLAVVAWQKLRCITSSQVWSWHCAKKSQDSQKFIWNMKEWCWLGTCGSQASLPLLGLSKFHSTQLQRGLI